MRKMKSSEVEWIGEIPNDWQIIRLRFLCSIQTGNMDTQNNNPEGKYPFYVRSPIVERSSDYTFDNEAVLMAGDGVGAGKVFHYVNGKYGCHQRVYSMSNFIDIKGKFLYYYLLENFYKKMDESNAKATVDSVRMPMLKDFPITLPSINIQRKIVNYLDNKCYQIDNTVALYKKSLDKLISYKQSVINEKVSKGLNSDAKFKLTGLKWLPSIPNEWSTIKLKYAALLKGRIGWQGLKSDEYIDEGAYLITGTDFYDGKINWDTCVHISKERYYEAPEIHIKEGDLLITKDGTIGKVAIVRNCPKEVSLNSGILLIRNEKTYKYINKYLYYVLLSDEFWIWYESGLSGNSTIRHLYQEQFYNFEFSFPPLDEQQEIADYLDDFCIKIDKAITKKQSIIDKLIAYKKSLVYEVITGKKEV